MISRVPFRAVPRAFALLLGGAFLFSPTARGTEPPLKLKVAFFNIPPGIFFYGVPAEGKLNAPLEGLEKVSAPQFYPNRQIYNARRFIENLGIDFPKGAEAYYLGEALILYVKNTEENLDLLYAMTEGCSGPPRTTVRHEFFVAEFTASAARPEAPVPTFSELRKAAGKSWKQLGSVEIAAKISGTSQGIFLTGTAAAGPFSGPLPAQESAKPEAPALALGASGVSVAVQSIVGPDFYSVDSVVSFLYQTPNPGGAPLSFAYSGEVTLENTMPQVLQIFPSPDGTRRYALIERVTLTRPDSTAIPTVKPSPDAQVLPSPSPAGGKP